MRGFMGLDKATRGRLIEWMTAPVFSTLMRHRVSCLLLSAALVVQLGTTLGGLRLWSCPLPDVTGVPCPGCGLTRSSAALLHGSWFEAVRVHPLGLVALLGMTLLAIAALSPRAWRDALCDVVAWMERRLAITSILSFALIACWIVRLMPYGPTFAAVSSLHP